MEHKSSRLLLLLLSAKGQRESFQFSTLLQPSLRVLAPRIPAHAVLIVSRPVNTGGSQLAFVGFHRIAYLRRLLVAFCIVIIGAHRLVGIIDFAVSWHERRMSGSFSASLLALTVATLIDLQEGQVAANDRVCHLAWDRFRVSQVWNQFYDGYTDFRCALFLFWISSAVPHLSRSSSPKPFWPYVQFVVCVCTVVFEQSAAAEGRR